MAARNDEISVDAKSDERLVAALDGARCASRARSEPACSSVQLLLRRQRGLDHLDELIKGYRR